jgi:glutamate synthase (NADPH/NADH) small chain
MPTPPISPKERLAIPRQSMPMQDATARSATFTEVNQGYDQATAVLEAQRCLQCKNAKCVAGCPVQVDIPGFVALVASGDIKAAAELLLKDNCLPAVTGRVCPQETQCEALCIRAVKGESVGIGYVERFVADWAREHGIAAPASASVGAKGTVAVIGSGPCGLTVAGEMSRMGHTVTVFEAFHTAGGVLVYGIPAFRLPKDIVQAEVDRLKNQGVAIELNAVAGKTVTIPELKKEYDAIVIAVGAGLPVFMEVPGEDLRGVYSANEFLTRVNLMGAYDFPRRGTPVLKGQRVAVVGGGNVAMDAVRTARRLGAEQAMIVYRRAREDLPARIEEVHHAEEEGVRFDFYVAPTEVVGTPDGWVKGLKCIRMKPGEKDASGRARPVPIPGSEFTIDCDQVVVAIGTKANPLLTSTCPDLKLNKWGNIVTDETHATSVPGIFAGGDITRGAATVILAMGDGKQIARSADAYIAKVKGG